MIERAYEVRGMLEKTTSYDASTGDTAVDQVLRQYNDWGLLAKEYQDHDSEVSDPPSGPSVEYLYEDGSNPTRLTGMVYPNGRELTYNYAAGDDAALGRVTSIIDDDTTVLASYSYLGLGNILAVAYPEPGVSYDLTHQDVGGNYDRLDQFGRVKSAYWTDGATALVYLNYGYDAAGNRTYREDVVAGSANLDELYLYDGMNQLTSSRRGQLNATHDGFESLTENSAQNWTLDATGNWSEFKEGTSQDNWTLDQDRTTNAANEIESASGWATPEHDQAGNMIFAPQPGNLSAGFNLKYDAWNRMVRVTKMVGQTEETVAEYRYDGDNRRIVKTTYDDGEPVETRHFYFSQDWQVLEERIEESPIPNPQSLIPVSQYVWGLRYIDDLIVRDRDADRDPETGGLGFAGSGLDERLYALQDANWNVVATYTAVNPTTGDQVTRYVYGSDLGMAGEALIACNDLLRAVIYPTSDDPADLSGDGQDGVYDRVEYRYNRQGEQTQVKDRNATVHDYLFDGLGRLTADKVTLPPGNPQNIDAAVLRIERAYEVRGMLEKTTSYDAATGGNAVDQVLREYNDWGLLAKEYQDHDSEVSDPPSGPCVEYLYEDGSNPTRLTGMVYPNGRELTYDYAAGDDAALGRVTSIVDDDTTVLASYSYLGLGNILAVAYPEPGVSYDLTHQDGSGNYDRFDQFGRVKSAYWTDGANALVYLNYGYDAAGNRTYREDVVAGSANLDELYLYDGMNQLTSSRRGQLNATHDGFESTTENFAQNWTLDATGNWSEFKEGTSQDNWTLDQDRTHDAANQVGVISGSGGNWADAVHDAAGNMTIMPDGNDPANYKLRCTYDAWNRLVTVERRPNNDSTGWVVVESCLYDGLNRRMIKEKYTAGALAERRYYFYDQDWQVLEERTGDPGAPFNYKIDWRGDPAKVQYVWGLRYVDDLVARDDDIDGSFATGDIGGFNHPGPRPTYSGVERRLYAMQDANWNVVAIADWTGTIQERYTYTAYGNAEFRTAAFAQRNPNASTLAWTVLYTGCNLDPETGLQINRNRYYHPDLGRFINRDPIGLAAGDVNLYRYVHNAPVIANDPMGLQNTAPGYVLTVAGPVSAAVARHQAAFQKLADAATKLQSVLCNPRNQQAIQQARQQFDSASREFNSASGGLSSALRKFGQDVGPSTLANLAKTGGDKGVQVQAIITNAQSQIPRLAKQAGQFNQIAQIDPNKLNHIFGNAGHNLGPVVNKCGSIVDAYIKIQNAVNTAAAQGKISGVFQTVVTVAGEQVTVRGNVANGVVTIGTAFVP